jgi:Zn finger protein HypA/HybF involved in hydrogenase expression
MHSIVLSCPDCQKEIRHFTKDLHEVRGRICPKCGQTINVQEHQVVQTRAVGEQ